MSKFINGYYVEGFIRLHSADSEQCDIALPFIGFRKGINSNDSSSFIDLDIIEKSIYEFDDLSSNDKPRYYDIAKDKNVFTALISKDGKDEVILGELAGENPRKFEKNNIAISPNDDGVNDYAQFRAVFLTHFCKDQIIIKDKSNSIIYTGEVNFSGGKDSEGHADIGKKSFAHTATGETGSMFAEYEAYKWDGKDNSNQVVEDGKYNFIFNVKGINDESQVQSYSYPIIVDTKAPEIKLKSVSGDKIYFKINEDGSGLSYAKLESFKDGTVKTVKELDNIFDNVYSSSYDEDIAKTSYVSIKDFAGNSKVISLASIAAGDKVGSPNIKTKSSGYFYPAIKANDYRVIISDDKGNIYPSYETLPFGTYKAKIAFTRLDAFVTNDVLDFEINEANKNTEIEFIVKLLQPNQARRYSLW